MGNTNQRFFRRNAGVIPAFVLYALCLLSVFLWGEHYTLLIYVMVGIGVLGVLVWGGINAANWLRMVKIERKPLTLSGIESVLRDKGLFPERAGDKQFLFQHEFNNTKWSLQYEEEIGRLVIGLVFPLDNPADADMVRSAAAEVMANHKMVRLYQKTRGEQSLFFLAIEAFQTRQAEFDRFFDKYLELMVDAMKAHDAICRKTIELRSRPTESNRIGFVNPMREKINEYDKSNPDASEAERKAFIESIRQ